MLEEVLWYCGTSEPESRAVVVKGRRSLAGNPVRLIVFMNNTKRKRERNENDRIPPRSNMNVELERGIPSRMQRRRGSRRRVVWDAPFSYKSIAVCRIFGDSLLCCRSSRCSLTFSMCMRIGSIVPDTGGLT